MVVVGANPIGILNFFLGTGAERPHSFLVKPGAEGVPQEMGTVLTFVDPSEF